MLSGFGRSATISTAICGASEKLVVIFRAGVGETALKVDFLVLPFGMEMPSALRKMLGHIDVELERGYLAHFQRPDVQTLQLEHIPDAFDSQYSVNYTRTSCYRTKYVVSSPIPALVLRH